MTLERLGIASVDAVFAGDHREIDNRTIWKRDNYLEPYPKADAAI